MKGEDKRCTVCGLEKRLCRDKLGIRGHDFSPDPRSMSTEAGIRQMSAETLLAMTRGRSGETPKVVELAALEQSRRRQIQGISDRCPLWALSPFEQTLLRSKGIPITQSGGYCRIT